MTLVHRNHTHRDALQLDLEEFGGKTFGRYVKELVSAIYAVLKGHDNLVARQPRIDGRRLDTACTQVVHLILHQGNQGSDDQAQSLLCQGWYLKGDTLAPACRHEAERIAPATDAFNDVLLNTTESCVAPVLLQYVEIGHDSSNGLMSSMSSCTSPCLCVFSSMV